jgi:cytochrome c oxidase subunit IV
MSERRTISTHTLKNMNEMKVLMKTTCLILVVGTTIYLISILISQIQGWASWSNQLIILTLILLQMTQNNYNCK